MTNNEDGGTLPAPPWMERRVIRRVRKPTASPLTRDAIVAEALALVDEEGLDALTVRRLGDRLGVTMMALYWHVRDKAQLLDLVGNGILAEIGFPDLTGNWQADLAALSRAAREGLRRHPNAAVLAFGRARYGPAGLAMFERMLAILDDAGFDAEQAGLAYMALYTFLRGNWSSEASVSSGREEVAEFRDYLRDLPAGRFPRTVEVGPRLFERNPDDYFEFGLAALLEGIAGQKRDPREIPG